MSTLKVNNIQDATGNNAISIDSSGNVTLAAGFVPQTAMGRRNLIINGAMQVAQRGTSFTSGTFTLDRWRHYNSGGTFSITQESFSSGSQPNSDANFLNYFRLTRSSPSGIFFLGQRIEDVRISDGTTYTFSFYAKASGSVTIPIRITQGFGGGGSVPVATTAQNISITTSWERHSITVTMDSLSGKTVGTSSYVEPTFDIPATTETIDITGVQLEVGSVATPFEHRSYGEELEACRRYYQASSDTVGNLTVYSGDLSSGSTYIDHVRFGTVMRAAPTVTQGTEIGNYGFPTSLNIDWQTTKGFRVYMAASSTVGGGYWMYQFTADAEL